ncbi:hypothetical protein [Bradyrhizobium sp. Ai1a-2]|uniref:hypothetical protein n=1 Tax=Bradyrhizobium sp. Ai1a-2 TaxID=196490 RepID=UPI0012686A79|nr:hypothetical protein [Bradyrhizobium sp. Ai1a-2]
MMDLIERLTNATESSFELNAAIARLDFYREMEGDMADDEIPDFLASIDAALTLVPAEYTWNINEWGMVQLFRKEKYPTGTGRGIEVSDKVRPAAIAICIAALRARLALEGMAGAAGIEPT